ncbi:MAG: sulfatase-like hydrolase/transferase [Oceanipulchritudo sp.]
MSHPKVCFSVFLIASACLPAATLPLIGPELGNGSFESDDGSGSSSPDAQFADWTTGLNVADNQRLNNNASSGTWSAVIGTGVGGRMGILQNTGYVVATGDRFSLSFDWADAFNWDDNVDTVNWRLLTTSDDTLSGTVTEIASGTNTADANTTNFSYQSETFTGLNGIVPANLGRTLWIEIYSATTTFDGAEGEFARVDNVVLTVETSQGPTPADLAPGMLQAWYPAEEDSLDYGDALLDGTWLAGEAYGPGIAGEAAFSFNGTDGVVQIPFAPDGDFTVSFWMRTASTGPTGTHWHDGAGLIDGSTAGINDDFGVSLLGDRVAFGIGNPDTTVLSATPVADGSWHHVAVRRSGLFGRMEVFINGLEDAEAAGPIGPRASASLAMGALLSGGGHYAGQLDDVRIFDAYLSDASIGRLFTSANDYDADGSDDLTEAIAATDWLDPASRFAIGSFELDQAAEIAELRTSGRAGRAYRLEKSPDLSAGSWFEVDAVPALDEDGEVVLTDTAAGPDASPTFYRMGAEGRGPAVPRRPNIVVIVMDDLGWADTSSNPSAVSEAHTPQLDRLGEQGVFFTNAYVTGPICSASRSGWNTGRHQNRWDATGSWQPGLPSSEETLAELLKAEGYTTGKVGKNDFGPNLRSPDTFSFRTYPGNHGYDSFVGFSAHAHDFWFHVPGGINVNGDSAHAGPLQWHDNLVTPSVLPQRRTYTGADDPGNLDEDPDDYYMTDLLTDEAIAFVEAHAGAEAPFFLNLSYSAVHHLTPQVPLKYLEAEAARLGWSSVPPRAEKYDPSTNTASNPSDYDAFYNYWNKVNNVGAGDMRKYYLANLRAVDENLGRVLDALEAAGIADNTLVIFFGDNGGPPETGANNGPLMGSKYNVFEGGIRIPFFARWPGKLPEGAIYPHVVSALDVVPTALQAAQVAIPPGDLDGISLLEPVNLGTPTVEDRDAPGLDGRTLYWRWQKDNWAVRKGPWKLVQSWVGRSGTFTDEVWFDYGIVGKKSLFNLEDSPSESMANDRITANPAMAAELEALYNNWKSGL